MVNANLTLLDDLTRAQANLDFPEQMLGKTLDQPCTPSDSGARKILYSIQKEHVVPVKNAERPIYSTGYENRFGDESSSIIESPEDQAVFAIIPKYNFAPQQEYTILAVSRDGRTCRLYKRISYEHTTENHGYTYNNSYMDALYTGAAIPKDTVIRRSNNYDNYGNRTDGVNAYCIYISTTKNTEDSIIMSETAATVKFVTPVINKITIICNNNDIPLNLQGGEDGRYKVIPDIGEFTKKGILYAQRRQDKEYEYFVESSEHMKQLMMSDDKYIVTGQVIDVDVYSNNPQLLQESPRYEQIYKYYQENQRYNSELINAVNQIITQYPGIEFDYDAQKEIFLAKSILAGKQYDNDKVFNNTIIELTLLQDKPVGVGDKMTDRNGAKGVVSFILPDDIMPKDQWGNVCDFIVNKSGCVGRENPAQLMEGECNYKNENLIRYIRQSNIPLDQAVEMLLSFLAITAPDQCEKLSDYFRCLDEDQLSIFLDSILMDGLVDTSTRPIQDNMSLDKLEQLCDTFPWIQMKKVFMPIQDSMGNYRMVPSFRPIIFAKKYFYRLKQYSEEKFSVTSLSSTNVKNLNTKSKANKYYKAPHSNTPIAMGTMEIDDTSHLGMEYVISILMIHSVSPQARRLCEQMITGDPFRINIKLDDESTNRNVEIVNAYLKTKGEQLVFTKKLKKKNALISQSLVREVKIDAYAIPLIRQVLEENYSIDKYYETLDRVKEMRSHQLVTRDLIQILDENGKPIEPEFTWK